jgi:sn-glycerol 3-phosphate transport system permease protein
MVERTRALDIACHALLVLGGLLVCLPIYFAFVVGSHTVGDVLAVPPPWLPGDRFFENAATAWQKGNLGRLLFNSLVVAVGITVGKIAVSLLSAFAISYFRFRYRMTAFWLIFASLMLPVEVRILPTYEAVTNVALPLQWLFDGLGIEVTVEWNMMNSYGGLILPLIASATATFLFRQFFLTVPEELCEAARIDGASPLHFFRHVLLPLSMSNMVALSIILFLYGWNQYLWPLLFTPDKDMATAVTGLKHLNAALLVMLPPALVVVALQRWLVKGLVDSGK